ncbi:XRE family transcriptional regulator [Gordonibacter sp. 28C]|uniref:helix-turn-helix domain-containing protein n=1 Tax=Gordonibacter sp. 28C TaxID=2078569 RepID=UPI000DF7776B|nr:helix-turn-helix transcriptional regulator [Gordonibacter sp. 28C]RDB61985.1 XRE family transcriptional regulator [Gordonibacter sp. 28C]
MSFADNLVYLRQHYGVTQESLAEQLGVSRQTVSKWEAGTNYPEMDKLLTLCDLFRTNLDDLMRGSVQVTNDNDTERYDRHMNRFDLSMVAGVAFILVGVGVQGALDAVGVFGENFEAAVFLAFVVVGAMILIMGALSHGEFKRRNPSIEPRYRDDVLDRFSRRFPLLVAGGVGLILLAVIFLVGMSPDDGNAVVGGVRLEDFLLLSFMLIIALGVGTIMWACLQKSKYDLSELTYIGHRRELGADLPSTANVKSPEQVRAESIMGVACGIIMLLAVIVFLVWGFVPLFDQVDGWDGMDKSALKEAVRSGQGGFAVSWIAFVVGGILCGIVCLAGSVLFKSQDDWIAEARQEDAWMKYAQNCAKDDPGARGPEQQADGQPDQTPTQAAASKEPRPSATETPRPPSATQNRSTWK